MAASHEREYQMCPHVLSACKHAVSKCVCARQSACKHAMLLGEHQCRALCVIRALQNLRAHFRRGRCRVYPFQLLYPFIVESDIPVTLKRLRTSLQHVQPFNVTLAEVRFVSFSQPCVSVFCKF